MTNYFIKRLLMDSVDVEIVVNRDLEWCIFDKYDKFYLDLYIWLTTRNIVDEKLGNTYAQIASFMLHLPQSSNYQIRTYSFWDNACWICKTFVVKDPDIGEDYIPIEQIYHFGMLSDNVLKHSPIPKFLVEKYLERDDFSRLIKREEKLS